VSTCKARIQVPVDEDFLAKLDEARKGRPRAEYMRECFITVYEADRTRELERAYIEGYTKIPDDSPLPEAQVAMASEVLSRDEW